MILVLSHPADEHAAKVLADLDHRGHSAALLDSSDFPVRASLTQRFSAGEAGAVFSVGGHAINLAQCGAAWWRRPLPHTLHDHLDPTVTSFTHTECHEAFSGALALIEAHWVNAPHLDERAHHKPLQLATAVRAGLDVPRTLITNDPGEARRFISDLGPDRTIYKTFLATDEHWRETRLVREQELGMLDSLRFAPVIFQEYIAADADLRVTIVGDEIFPTAIRPAPGGYAFDYRLDMAGADFAATTLPGPIISKLKELMRSLGIVYGAVDLRRTPDGGYVFLEVNPAGEWLFVEERTAQPITAAMATLLMRLDTSSAPLLNAKTQSRSRRNRTPH